MITQQSSLHIALLDIALIIGCAAGLFLAESLAMKSGVLPWGEDAKGIVSVVGTALLAIILVKFRGQSLSSIGLKRPNRWWTVPIWTIAIMVVFILSQGVIPALLSLFIELPEPDLSRYDQIKSNLGYALFLAAVLPLTAAIPEEIVYRGFLIERFGQVFSTGWQKAVLPVVLQAIVFGLIHIQWGAGGIAFTTMMGLIWGAAFVLCGRNLWIVIAAHSLAHILLIMQLYSAGA